MARRTERGRTTPAGTRNVDEMPSLRRRSPGTFWVLMFLVVAMLAGPVLLVLQQVFG